MKPHVEKCPGCGGKNVDMQYEIFFCRTCWNQYRRAPFFAVVINKRSPFFDKTRPIREST